ncbi:hypothetical protein [Streptomyces cyaneus]|uniref:hypothetical protein n=1 Tax=Streptomyces cyaneus TaxID=1904 RepID=UPI000FF889A8|nr:hypothetical protein [Streptomyces cyaneus]
MRSVRMLLATATATAALAIAPAAYAVTAGDWDHEDNSYSKEHDKKGKHDEPRGGMHTGGGALTAVTDEDHDWGGSKDPKPDKEGKHDDGGKHEDGGKHDEESKHEDPRGGVHTGGGALAAVTDEDHDWSGSKDPKPDKEGKHDDGGKHEDGGKHDEESKHEEPRGGVHTGGGALAAVNNDDDWGGAKDPKHDPDSYRSKDDGDSWGGDHDKGSWKEDDHEKDSWGGDHGKDSWGDDHGKPHGGMHTGGGGLASPGVTTAGLAALAVAGTGLYTLRRKKASGTVA